MGAGVGAGIGILDGLLVQIVQKEGGSDREIRIRWQCSDDGVESNRTDK